MTTNHLLIVTGECITPCSKYYTVAVADSEQGRRDYAFLVEYANRHNYYWKRVSNETDNFRLMIAHSFGMEIYDLLSMAISARDLVRHIKVHRETPPIPGRTNAAAYYHQLFKPSAYFNRQLDVLRQAEAKKRNKPKSPAMRPMDEPPLKKSTPAKRGRNK